MLSTKSIPVVPIVPAGGSEQGREEGKGCPENTLSFQSKQYEHLLSQTQQLQMQAQEQLKKAEREAEQLYYQAKQEVARWEEEATAKGFEKGFEEGTSNGFNQGYEAGKSQGIEAYQVEMDKLKTTWLSVNQQITQDLEAIAPQLVDLMVQAVEKITLQHFESTPQLLEACLQDMILSLGKRQRCVIQVAPEKVESIEAYVPTLTELTPGMRVQVLPNVALKPADCLLETELEKIDLTLDAQLETLKEVWKQAVKE